MGKPKKQDFANDISEIQTVNAEMTENGNESSISEPETVEAPQVSPLQAKLQAIARLNRLVEKRKRLAEIAEDIEQFVNSSTGEDEFIVLNTQDGEEITVKRPETVKRIIAMLSEDVTVARHLTEAEILAIAA